MQFLNQATGRREEEVLTSLEELLKRHLPVEDGVHYNFNHDLIRRVIYTGLSADRRRGLHRQVGQTLEAIRAKCPERNGIVGEIAKHFYESGQWEQAVDYALLAAQRAWASYAKREAIGFYEMALELAEKLKQDHPLMEVYQGLAEVHCLADKIDEGIQYGLKALQRCDQLEKRAEIYCAIATAYQRKRELEKAWGYCKQALQTLGPENRSPAAVRTYYQASSFLNWLFRYDEAMEYCQRSLRVLDQTKDENGLALIYSSLAQSHMGKRDYQGAIEYGARAAALAEKTGDLYSIVNAFFQLALAHFESGNVDETIKVWRKSLIAADSMQAQRYMAIIYDRLSYAYMRQGQIDDALGCAHKLLAVSTELNDPRDVAIAQGMLGCLYDVKHGEKQAQAAFKQAGPRRRWRALGTLYDDRPGLCTLRRGPESHRVAGARKDLSGRTALQDAPIRSLLRTPASEPAL